MNCECKIGDGQHVRLSSARRTSFIHPHTVSRSHLVHLDLNGGVPKHGRWLIGAALELGLVRTHVALLGDSALPETPNKRKEEKRQGERCVLEDIDGESR
jgi:hypothetical protein